MTLRSNWLEWVVLAVSAVSLVGLVGFLIVDGITDGARAPQPRVQLQIEAAYQSPSGWIVPATVTNTGDRAAEALVLRATAIVNGAEEDSEVTIDFLPPGTDVEISFGLSAEPDGDIAVQTIGFRLP